MATKTTKKKKSKKMDRLLVSKQKHEIKTVAKKTKKPQKEVRAAQKQTRSRKGVEKILREQN